LARRRDFALSLLPGNNQGMDFVMNLLDMDVRCTEMSLGQGWDLYIGQG